MRFGIGLWTGQSTVLSPRHHGAAYRDLVADAVEAERLGFESFWTSEHHFYYDGYCPSPLTTAGAVLAATDRLRFGTGVLLLPLQDPHRVTSAVGGLLAEHGPRLELGVSLGYRDIEFDGKAVSRRHRLRRHLAAVDDLRADGDRPHVPLWVGAHAVKSVRRAGSLGLGLLLPGSATVEHVADLAAEHRAGWDEAGRPGGRPPEVATLRNVWICDDAEERRAAEDWVRCSYVLYQGLGYSVAATENAESIDFASSFDDAVASAVRASMIGSGAAVAERIAALADAGVSYVMLRATLEGAPREAVREQLRRLSAEILPLASAGGAT